MQQSQIIVNRFQRVLKIKFIQNACGNGHYYKIPGFKYDDFNRTGFIGRVKIQRLLESSIFSQNFVFHNINVFFLGGETIIDRKLYNEITINTPLNIHTYLCKIGSTSVDFKTVAEIDDDAKNLDERVIISRVNRVVSVDLKTRKSVPIPEEFRNENAGILKRLPFPVPNFLTLDTSTWDIPEKHFSHKINVRHEDMDFFNHTNQGSYTIFTGECATFAAKSGFYRSIDKDIAFYPTKYEYNLHKGESHAGDELEVVTWQHPTDDYTTFFVVKKNEKPIYFSKLQLFNDL